ncbi:hypothetical protein [Arenimonas sp.]|uniref:hypothetical protein n=1 Tax=Arenimonas sp. TaxID=1872635 RepID=UPI0039E2B60A
MQNSTYRYSAEHILSGQRTAIAGALVPGLLVAAIAVGSAVMKSWIAAAIFGVIGVASAYQAYRNVQEARRSAAQMREMGIELATDALRLFGPDGTAEVPLASIVSVQVARRGGRVRATRVNLPSGDALVIAGIDRLEEFTTSLSRLVGQSKVQEFRWWQAHPA